MMNPMVNTLTIPFHTELYDVSPCSFSSGGELESYVNVIKHDPLYYILDTTHDNCDIDIQSNRVVIVSLKQLDALQRAIDAVREDMLMNVMQEENQNRGEYE